MAEVRGFVEYNVKPEKREEYIQLMRALSIRFRSLGLTDYYVYESHERPNQFLETFTARTQDEYERVREQAYSGGEALQKPYRRLHDCIEGGTKSAKRWFFELRL